MSYVPGQVSNGDLQLELERIAEALMDLRADYVRLREWNAEPDKVFDGMVVKADGSNWNPDATNGEGVYCFYNSTWNYLG